jgi:glutamate synthase (NADPH/NADH) large chain
MVELERVTDEADEAELRALIENHFRYTGSTVAGHILETWNRSLPLFQRVMPTDYRRALQEMAAAGAAK